MWNSMDKRVLITVFIFITIPRFGFKTTRLDTVKAIILSSDEYCGDFDKCVTLYKDFIKEFDGQLEWKIAAVHSGTVVAQGSVLSGISQMLS
jgi:hypothetical protein